jgi:hypothetical protein
MDRMGGLAKLVLYNPITSSRILSNYPPQQALQPDPNPSTTTTPSPQSIFVRNIDPRGTFAVPYKNPYREASSFSLRPSAHHCCGTSHHAEPHNSHRIRVGHGRAYKHRAGYLSSARRCDRTVSTHPLAFFATQMPDDPTWTDSARIIRQKVFS